MHDSGWLIFAFSSETEMLEIMGEGSYYVFGQPLILKVMPNFFDFQSIDMTKVPTWVRFPNLPLRCWTPICLSKIASMIGKPIHYDGPTANMTWLSYARVLIEVDLLLDLPTSVNVVLSNGTSLPQQVIFESLPCFYKKRQVLGHSTTTCNKGTSSKRKKRPLLALACSANSSPSAKKLLLRSRNHIVQSLLQIP